MGKAQEPRCERCNLHPELKVSHGDGAAFTHVVGPTCFGAYSASEFSCNDPFEIKNEAGEHVGHIKQLQVEHFPGPDEFTAKSVLEVDLPDTWSQEKAANMIGVAILTDELFLTNNGSCSMYCAGCICCCSGFGSCLWRLFCAAFGDRIENVGDLAADVADQATDQAIGTADAHVKSANRRKRSSFVTFFK